MHLREIRSLLWPLNWRAGKLLLTTFTWAARAEAENQRLRQRIKELESHG